MLMGDNILKNFRSIDPFSRILAKCQSGFCNVLVCCFFTFVVRLTYSDGSCYAREPIRPEINSLFASKLEGVFKNSLQFPFNNRIRVVLFTTAPPEFLTINCCDCCSLICGNLVGYVVYFALDEKCSFDGCQFAAVLDLD